MTLIAVNITIAEFKASQGSAAFASISASASGALHNVSSLASMQPNRAKKDKKIIITGVVDGGNNNVTLWNILPTELQHMSLENFIY